MKPSLIRISFLSTALLLLLSLSAQATHLRAGEITVRRDACNSLKFWITVTVYTNTISTNVLFGGDDDILDFGDGSDPDGDGKPGILVPETQNTLRPDLGEGIATASFTIDHIYAAGSSYTISYSEPNRNEGVINMDGSVNTRFYIESEIIIDPFLGCNEHTPVLEVPPIDRGCTGVAWFHNPGAYDLDGDSLSYEMVVPYRERVTEVVNYRSPDNPGFYKTNYETGNEQGTGRPTFAINAVDGTISWDSPGTAGEYNIAFIINEWRRLDGEWIRIGFVRRDMQIIIEDCENKRPDLIVPEDICVEAGTTLDATIFGTDPDNNPVKIEAFSEIFFLAEAQSPATKNPDEPVYAAQPAQLQFQWKTECSHVKDQPYQVVFKVTDDSESGPNLVTFKTWLIRVVGPKPQFPENDAEAISIVPDTRFVKLDWDEYFCENAETMQIWRRVDSLAFEPDTCQTGMPDYLGYELIAQVPISGETSYTDTNGGKGLNTAAVYCYRLVAIFPSPRGGESPVSKEVCIPAIITEAPVITNVTVDRTGEADGEITVKWVQPPQETPTDVTYHVYRAEGLSGQSNLVKITPDAGISETTVKDVGLNTFAKAYNYQVLGKPANDEAFDSSAVASSVRLVALSQPNKIALQWSANVPWSNQISGYKHRIYRGDEGASTPDQLALIGEVEVVGSGFTYEDEGQHNGVPLEAGRVYCYLIETLGSYGLDDEIPGLPDPLFNFSQIVCTQPGDTIPPCKPIPPVAHNPLSCEEYFATNGSCNRNVFENVIKWNRVTDDCGLDIASYNIYYTRSTDVEFQLIAQVTDTIFTHRGLTSFAGCYRISAVDRSGNESELSDQICLDNCPYYELPNIFTPNTDGCNDVFSAYNNRDTGGESGEASDCRVLPESNAKCARFVEDVTFTVFNRWGKEVYSYTTVGSGDNTIFIDWNGKASDGTDLSSGIYYYIADVVFNVVDPAKKNQQIKGWVQIAR